MLAVQWLFWAVGLGLEVLVLSALLGGPGRRFPFAFLYVVGLFLTTNVEIAATFLKRRDLFVKYYWIDEVILQVLIFCVVISLLYKGTEQAKQGAALRRFIVVGGILAFGFPFMLHYDPQANVSSWMTTVSRDLYFISAFLDLVLWSVLIAARKKDHVLLLLSGGLGIQFAGSAIAAALGALFIRGPVVKVTGILLVLLHLTNLYVWWRAFRHVAVTAKSLPIARKQLE